MTKHSVVAWIDHKMQNVTNTYSHRRYRDDVIKKRRTSLVGSYMEVLRQAPISTYGYSYKGDQKRLSPIRYFQIKSLVHRHARLQPPRQFPIEPQTPHRIINKDSQDPILGSKDIGTEQFLEPKPILQTPAPQEVLNLRPSDDKINGRPPPGWTREDRVFYTKFGKMDSDLINRLSHQFRWTSATQKSVGEACLPITQVSPPTSTLESKADMIRLSGQRYETSSAEWQDAVLWDKIQLRGQVLHEDLNEKATSMPEKILFKRIKDGSYKGNQPIEVSPTISKLVTEDKLNNVYIRQCPGYAGFVPRQPPKVDMERKMETAQMTSVMKVSYRELPVKEYKRQEFARKGPMSRTVTLTYPFNPFNKITTEPVLPSPSTNPEY